MMKWIFAGLIVLASIFGALNGRLDQVSNAAMTECGSAINLVISLSGAMCMWSGIMKVAELAGLTQKIARFFAPVIRLLFHRIEPDSPAARAITLNISANLLGLGNAATPLGLQAMSEMAKETGNGFASDNMILFVVLNTASLQLVPTTTALLRANNGSADPLDIMPAVWAASLLSVVSGVIGCKLLQRLRRYRTGQERLP